MKEFKKLSKEELKLIFAGGSSGGGGAAQAPCNNCGGSQNPPTGGNGERECGVEPAICASTEWAAWRECMRIHNFTPNTFLCA